MNIILPQTHKNARIGILGGSFNPPHLCHQLLALSVLATEPLDQLWIVPCADHPFNKQLIAFEHRFAMSQLAFSRLGDSVQVIDIENKLPVPSFTINTLDAINNIRPDIQLYFVVGSDIVSQIERWHKPERLGELSTIIIFERDGFTIDKIPSVISQAKVHKGYALPNVSSTYVREHIGGSKLIDLKVEEYISKNKLYV